MCVLLGLGGLICVANWMIVVQWLWTRRHISMLPLVGGMFAAAGCALVPALGWKAGVVALAIDPGGALMLVAVPVDAVWRRLRR